METRNDVLAVKGLGLNPRRTGVQSAVIRQQTMTDDRPGIAAVVSAHSRRDRTARWGLMAPG